MGRKRSTPKRRRNARRSAVVAPPRQTRLTLAIEAEAGDELPTEFRIFEAGWNHSENGSVLFDDAAAKATIAAFERHGVDRMIDLEHLSLDQESASFDPDARGWLRLELRNGELWAVDVKWTEDGADRLRSKRQRFISPTFFFDDKSKRVTKILNVALTALPATHGLPELVAARVATGTKMSIKANKMTPEQVNAALAAIEAGDAAAALELLKALVASMLGAEDGAGEEAPADVEGEGEGAPPAESAEGDEEEEDEAAAAALADEDASEVVAATARLLRLTDRKTVGAALEEAAVWRASHIELEAKRKKLDAERVALELTERKSLAVKLTKLGAETPATTGLNVGKLKKRLLDEPIQELRDRVKELSEANAGGKSRAGSNGATPPVTTGTNPHGLTDSQLAACKEYKCDPATFAMLNARGKQAS